MDRDFFRKDLQQYLSSQKWAIKTTFMVVPLAESRRLSTRTFTQTHKILAIEKTDF